MKAKHIIITALMLIMGVNISPIMAQSGKNSLAAGSKLMEGQRLVSANQKYYLTVQPDGNLCIYTSSNTFVWCNMVTKGNGSYLSMQADGNLVVYDNKNKAGWYSMTQAYFDPKYSSSDWKPVRAVLEDNGTLSLYTAANKKVWNNTDKKEKAIVDPGVGFTGPTVVKNLKFKMPNSNVPGNYDVEITNTGEVFYNGDMKLGTVESLSQDSPKSPEVDSYLWPNSTVYYVLPNGHERAKNIREGIDYLNTYTNICMVQRTNQKDYVEFVVETTGNHSSVGRIGGRQEIHIENPDMITVVHEVMHALGFHHTQAREDRDKFVTINFSKIQKGKEHNFQKSFDKQSNLGVYDYTSCMHYSSEAFTVKQGTKTIIRKDGSSEEMGSWVTMSPTDVANIAAVYPKCPSKSAVKPLPSASKTDSDICGAKDAKTKYQTSMKPGDRLLENEKLVSANGRFQFRVTPEGEFVIEEILNSGTCPYHELYRFPIERAGEKPEVSFFSYNPDGNICMVSKQQKGYCVTNGRDATASVILNKSVKLTLTDDGRLSLINGNGEDIWATSAPRGTRTAPPPTTPGTRTAPTTTAPGVGTRTAPQKEPVPVRTAPVKEPIKHAKPTIPIRGVSLNTQGLTKISNPNFRSNEGLTPEWRVDMGSIVYVEYIVIKNSPNAQDLRGRSFYVTTGTSSVTTRPSYEPAADNAPFIHDINGRDRISSEKVLPLGPYMWNTNSDMVIPIQRYVKIMSISLQKEGIDMTPLHMADVEIYQKAPEPPAKGQRPAY